MARAATTSDVFNAIAEQQRREILVLLRAGEGPVSRLALTSRRLCSSLPNTPTTYWPTSALLASRSPVLTSGLRQGDWN
jgi:hypothetical protein